MQELIKKYGPHIPKSELRKATRAPSRPVVVQPTRRPTRPTTATGVPEAVTRKEREIRRPPPAEPAVQQISPKDVSRFKADIQQQIKALQASKHEQYTLNNRKYTKSQLIAMLKKDYAGTNIIERKVKEQQTFMQHVLNIKWEGAWVHDSEKLPPTYPSATIGEDGTIQFTKPQGMPDEEWAYQLASRYPDDAKFTVTEIKDGKKREKIVSKKEMMKITKRQHELYWVAVHLGRVERDYPVLYWVHTVASTITNFATFVPQFIMEASVPQLELEDQLLLQTKHQDIIIGM